MGRIPGPRQCVHTQVRRRPNGYYEVGVAVGGSFPMWRWVQLAARRKDAAAQQAPAVIGQLLGEYAQELLDQARELNRQAARLLELGEASLRGEPVGGASIEREDG